MRTKAIIFTRMKKEADLLCERLVDRGYKAGALHGDMEQRERQKSIRAFKDSSVNILVATDIAARGLDISGVSHVFNFHIPLNPESYVHRIGRTGRAGKKGVAITLATPLEFKELRRIKENTKAKIELYEIPNLQDTLDKKDGNLLEKIVKYEITDEALRVYEQIRANIDITQLVCKLLSMVLQDNKVLGPNKIGLDKEDLYHFKKQLQENDKRRTKETKKMSSKTNNASPKKRSNGHRNNKDSKNKRDSRAKNSKRR